MYAHCAVLQAPSTLPKVRVLDALLYVPRFSRNNLWTTVEAQTMFVHLFLFPVVPVVFTFCLPLELTIDEVGIFHMLAEEVNVKDLNLDEFISLGFLAVELGQGLKHQVLGQKSAQTGKFSLGLCAFTFTWNALRSFGSLVSDGKNEDNVPWT